MSGDDDTPMNAGELPCDRKRRLATARKRRQRERKKNNLVPVALFVEVDLLTDAMAKEGLFVKPSRGELPNRKKLTDAYLRYLRDNLSELSHRDTHFLEGEGPRAIVDSKLERVDVDEVR